MMKTRAELVLKSIECEISESRWECAIVEGSDGWSVGLVAMHSSDSVMVDSDIMGHVGRAIEEFDAEMFVCEETVPHSLEYSDERVAILIQ